MVLDFLAVDNFDFTRKIVKKFLGEKLVKMFGFCQNWIFGQKFDFSNSVYLLLWLISKLLKSLKKLLLICGSTAYLSWFFEGHVSNRFIQGLFARVLHYNFVPPCVVGFLMAFTVTLCYGLYSCFEIRTLIPINTRENVIVALVNGNI